MTSRPSNDNARRPRRRASRLAFAFLASMLAGPAMLAAVVGVLLFLGWIAQ